MLPSARPKIFPTQLTRARGGGAAPSLIIKSRCSNISSPPFHPNHRAWIRRCRSSINAAKYITYKLILRCEAPGELVLWLFADLELSCFSTTFLLLASFPAPRRLSYSSTTFPLLDDFLVTEMAPDANVHLPRRSEQHAPIPSDSAP